MTGIESVETKRDAQTTGVANAQSEEVMRALRLEMNRAPIVTMRKTEIESARKLQILAKIEAKGVCTISQYSRYVSGP